MSSLRLRESRARSWEHGTLGIEIGIQIKGQYKGRWEDHATSGRVLSSQAHPITQMSPIFLLFHIYTGRPILITPERGRLKIGKWKSPSLCDEAFILEALQFLTGSSKIFQLEKSPRTRNKLEARQISTKEHCAGNPELWHSLDLLWLVYVQRSAKKYANIAKQDPGRARQSS